MFKTFDQSEPYAEQNGAEKVHEKRAQHKDERLFNPEGFFTR